jgi:DNA anti-recombination protein RmuC
MEQFVRDWAGALAALVGIAFAWRLGIAQNAWKTQQLEKELSEIKDRVKSLEAHRLSDVEILATIQTTLTQMSRLLTEIREELKTKADK